MIPLDHQPTPSASRTIGWQEWLVLPDLELGAIKAKVDTGAKTSAIYALNQELFDCHDETWVRFATFPIQDNEDFSVVCEAKLIDKREVTNSGGDTQSRYVIETIVELGGKQWLIEITLSNRAEMRYRMLLGRQAIVGRYVIDPGASFLCGKLKPKTVYNLNSK